MRNLISLATGSLFGIGLVISGMTDTLKVQGFLDLFGAWDPSLVFVMGGAIIPMFIAWRVAEKRNASLVGSPLPTPPNTKLDRPLIIGAILFGMGWALAGFCPGPALASITFGGTSGIVFMIAMLAGMYGFAMFNKIRA
jgi:uncharacterized membrane protein YedE/YeeE